MKYSKYLLAALAFGPIIANAHGGDKPGPHGGNVEMPGAFHTELVIEKDQSARVYLIDINFQNPSIKDSSVKMIARNKKKEVSFTCSAMEDHFHCVPSKKYDAKSEIIVKAVRENAVGNDVTYKLPLKFNTSKEIKDSEHSHH